MKMCRVNFLETRIFWSPFFPSKHEKDMKYTKADILDRTIIPLSTQICKVRA